MVSTIDEEEGCFTCGKVWSYMIAGQYQVDVLVPDVLGHSPTVFLECGFIICGIPPVVLLLCGWYGAEKIW